MESSEKFLPGFAWPVHKAHAAFVNSNCFDGGSLFHSDACAHSETWQRPRYSVQVIDAQGEPGVRAAMSNGELPLICDLIDWAVVDTRRYTTNNAALIALLKTDDLNAFLNAVSEI